MPEKKSLLTVVCFAACFAVGAVRAQTPAGAPQATASLQQVVDLRDEWNLVGLSVAREAADSDYRDLYPPEAVEGTLFAYAGSYFRPDPPVLVPREGYWLRMDGAATSVISGGALLDLAVDLRVGWNLVAGPSCTIPLATVADPGGVVIDGTLFGYAGAYEAADALVPGHGYWLRASAEGAVTFSCGAAKVPGIGQRPSAPAAAGRLVLADAAGHRAVLYYGGVQEVPTHGYVLPPVPPAGAFDVRFADGTYAAPATGGTILLQAAGPLTVTAPAMPPGDGYHLEAFDAGGKRLSSWAPAAGEAWVLPAGSAFLELSPVASPSALLLEQAYPSPFQGRTTISVGLPVTAHATLVVYDALGREVSRLHDGEMTAGRHEVVFDAAGLPSGLYLYRLTTPAGSRARTVLLVR